jgi:hypothetical protein
MTDPTPAKLRELLLNEFTEDELKALSASLNIDYDKLAGTGTFGKTRALLDTVKSQDKLRNLQAQIRELRPAAYEAAGFSTLVESEAIASADAPTTPIPLTRQTSKQQAMWPWIVLASVVLLCLIAGIALLVPRLQTANVAAPATQAQVVSSPTIETVNVVAATETPPAIVEVTDSLDKGAGEMTTTLPTIDPNAPATDTPVPPTTASAEATSTSVNVGAATTITPEVTATGSVVPTDTHPSSIVIGDLNAQLPQFYRGEVDVQAIQQYWTGEALRSVTGFGTIRLPRAMRIQPSQRNTLDVTYAYRNGPTLVRETRDGALVTSREYWRYATSANPTEICETRDYVYNMVRVDGQYKVSEFSSRLVDNGCD